MRGETLTSVLERCGGIRIDGYLPALILTRQSVRLMQQKELERASAQVQTQITRAALLPSENDKQQQPSLQQKADALLMLKNMIQGSDQKMAIGRIVLNIGSLAGLQGSIADIALEESDEIIVPKRPASVNVIGQVHGPTAVLYDPALTVRDYIDRAGGLSQIADKDELFVVKANGSVVSAAGYDDSRKGRIFPLLPLISGGIMSSHLSPGDTIYVPPEFLFINPIQRTLDVTQTLRRLSRTSRRVSPIRRCSARCSSPQDEYRNRQNAVRRRVRDAGGRLQCRSRAHPGGGGLS